MAIMNELTIFGCNLSLNKYILTKTYFGSFSSSLSIEERYPQILFMRVPFLKTTTTSTGHDPDLPHQEKSTIKKIAKCQRIQPEWIQSNIWFNQKRDWNQIFAFKLFVKKHLLTLNRARLCATNLFGMFKILKFVPLLQSTFD